MIALSSVTLMDPLKLIGSPNCGYTAQIRVLHNIGNGKRTWTPPGKDITCIFILLQVREVRRKRCEVENLEHRLRKMKLKWFVNVKCRDENSILRSAMALEVEDGRPVGWPKKTCSKVVEEDMRKLNITEDMAEDRKQRRQLITCPTPEVGNWGRSTKKKKMKKKMMTMTMMMMIVSSRSWYFDLLILYVWKPGSVLAEMKSHN